MSESGLPASINRRMIAACMAPTAVGSFAEHGQFARPSIRRRISGDAHRPSPQRRRGLRHLRRDGPADLHPMGRKIDQPLRAQRRCAVQHELRRLLRRRAASTLTASFPGRYNDVAGIALARSHVSDDFSDSHLFAKGGLAPRLGGNRDRSHLQAANRTCGGPSSRTSNISSRPAACRAPRTRRWLACGQAWLSRATLTRRPRSGSTLPFSGRLLSLTYV